MLSGAAIGLGFYAFNAHVISYANDVGLSADAAALIFTVSGVGGGAGHAAGRGVHRQDSAIAGACWCSPALNAVAIFLYIPAGSAWAFYLLGVLLGFAFSGAVPVRMAIIPPLFGTRAVGTIIGLASLSFSVGAIAGPFLAGYIFDSTGSYDLAFLIFGIFLAGRGRRRSTSCASPKPLAAAAASTAFGERGRGWDNRLTGCAGRASGA